MDEAPPPETRRLGYFPELDEILPHVKGFSHEIQTIGGSWWIVADELLFERRSWRAMQHLPGQSFK